LASTPLSLPALVLRAAGADQVAPSSVERAYRMSKSGPVEPPRLYALLFEARQAAWIAEAAP